MRFAIIGRTNWLLDSAFLLIETGHEIRMVLTAPAAPECGTKEADFENLAKKHGVPFRSTAKINSPDTLAWIRACGPMDIAVSVNYSGVLGCAVIDHFPFGILNAHGGDLPRFRGNACQAWALLTGETRIGLCIHRMIPDELDSGDIIEHAYLPVGIDTRIGQVYEWMHREIPNLFNDALRKISEKSPEDAIRQSKNPGDSLRCFARRPRDGEIHWGASATSIVRLINASSEPYSGAFAAFEGRKIIIWRAQLAVVGYPYLAIAGQVLAKEGPNGGVVVAAGDGAIEVTEVDEGEGRASPSSRLRSLRSRLE